MEAQLARLAGMGIGAEEARPFCDGVTDVETLVGLVMDARDRSVQIGEVYVPGIPGLGLPAVVARPMEEEEEEGGGRGTSTASTATESKACVIL